MAAHELEIKLLECTGVHNGFIISTPKHPFLKACIDKIIENVEEREMIPYPSVRRPTE